jgi:hypothetical protein
LHKKFRQNKNRTRSLSREQEQVVAPKEVVPEPKRVNFVENESIRAAEDDDMNSIAP